MSQNKSPEYYGVYVPKECRGEGEVGSKFVYHVRADALAVARQYKKARFKAFSNYMDALLFAQDGYQFTKSLSEDSEIKDALVGEKQSPFRAPKSQELVKFRKAIEVGDIGKVYQIIWDNPRFLVSSGDTPSILQEGSRYNALHVAAKAKNHEICELILQTISNNSFIKLLYGDSNYDEDLAKDRIKVLVDLYLNTPDKGLNETPLHFAVKFGAVEVVQVLVSYPQCDKTLKNKYGKTPDMIICDRCDESEIAAKKRKITLLLEGSYYVPVLRAEDNSLVPTIGEPFSPGSPPVLNKDPLSPRLEIRAYAGPLNRKDAEQFRRVWKTPPRNSAKDNRLPRTPNSVVALRYRDPERGLERLGNTLASTFDVGWKEYWPFLDSFIDITSSEGLRLFENYLSLKGKQKNCNREIFELANLLENCTLKDRSSGDEVFEDNFRNPYLCIEKACQVYANRLTNSILQSTSTPDSDFEYVLEKEVIQIHSLIKSYLNDARFQMVNFQSVHTRLGKMISLKLWEMTCQEEFSTICEKLGNLKGKFSTRTDKNGSTELILESVVSNGAPVNFIECLIDKILANTDIMMDEDVPNSTEDDCLKLWTNANGCKCILQQSVNNPSSKRGSIKRKYGSSVMNVSKRLSFTEDADSNTDKLDCNQANEDEGEDFFTPPSSPTRALSDDEEEFQDAKTLHEDIFIEGDEPTKIDCEVFDALVYSGCVPSVTDFPNVYRWYHAVSLYSDAERRSWHGVNKKVPGTPGTPSSRTSTPGTPTTNMEQPPQFRNSPVCSDTSWIRVTGVNSPKASIKTKLI